MYEAAYAHPAGESTVARLAATAADLEFDGLVVRNHDEVRSPPNLEAVRAEYGVDVVPGVEIAVDDPAQASGHLGAPRPDEAVVCLAGRSTELNQFAVSQARIDVLADPMTTGDLNHVMVRQAKANGVHLEVNLAAVLRTEGGGRVRALADLRKLRELISAYDAPFVVSGGPRGHLALRAPRELLAVGEAIGFGPATIETGLAAWGRIAADRRNRATDDVVGPGVRRGPYADSRDSELGDDDTPGGTDR